MPTDNSHPLSIITHNARLISSNLITIEAKIMAKNPDAVFTLINSIEALVQLIVNQATGPYYNTTHRKIMGTINNTVSRLKNLANLHSNYAQLLRDVAQTIENSYSYTHQSQEPSHAIEGINNILEIKGDETAPLSTISVHSRVDFNSQGFFSGRITDETLADSVEDRPTEHSLFGDFEIVLK